MPRCYCQRALRKRFVMRRATWRSICVTRDDLSLYDIAYSAVHHRDVFPHRLAATGLDRHATVLALEQFAATGAASGIRVGKHRPDASAPAFIYSGNGSQWAGMGLQLMQDDAAAREALIEVDALYARRSGESILAELGAAAGANRFSLTEIAQPALFAVQVALTRALERRGVRPIAVCGHSVGEVAAAWASGALTLEQAVRVIHERSSHQGRTRGRGCMTAVSLTPQEAVATADRAPSRRAADRRCGQYRHRRDSGR